MKTGKTAVILAAIVGGALLFIGCGKIKLPTFEEMATLWNSDNATPLSDPGKDPAETNAAPFLVDIDRNGTLDLLVGYASGRIEVVLNGSSTDFTLDYSYYLTGDEIGPAQAKPDGPTIFCADAAPALYNLNNATPEKPDADWAFIVGCGNGAVLANLVPYADFAAVTANDLIALPSLTAAGGYAVPVVNLNGDTALPDLVYGAGDGRVYNYGNIGTVAAPAPGLIGELAMGAGDFGSRAAIASVYLDFNRAGDYVVGNAAGDLRACQGPAGKCYFILWAGGTLAKPAVGDFNHDILPDLVYGNGSGDIFVLPAKF